MVNYMVKMPLHSGISGLQKSNEAHERNPNSQRIIISGKGIPISHKRPPRNIGTSFFER
jgi:hypothetical protein